MENEEKARFLGFAHPFGNYINSKEDLEPIKEKSKEWKNIFTVISGDKLYLIFNGKMFMVALERVENEDEVLDDSNENNEVKDEMLVKQIIKQMVEIISHWFGREPKTDVDMREYQRDLAVLETLERLIHVKQE